MGKNYLSLLGLDSFIHKEFRHSCRNGEGSSSCVVSPVLRTLMWDAGDGGSDVTWSVSGRLVCISCPSQCHRHTVIPGLSLTLSAFIKDPQRGAASERLNGRSQEYSALTVRLICCYFLL